MKIVSERKDRRDSLLTFTCDLSLATRRPGPLWLRPKTGLCICVLLFFPGLLTSVKALDMGERLQFADGLYARAMYDLAIKEYKAFLQAFPDSGKAGAVHFRMGESYRRLGNRVAAGKEFRRVFARYPKSKFRFKAGFRRADLFMETGQYDAAIELFNALLKEKPPKGITAASLYFLGDALLKNKKTDEAIKTLKRVKDQHPSSDFYSYALLKLGQIYGEQAGKEGASTGPKATGDVARRMDKALELYKTAAAKPSSDRVGAEALFQMAELYFRRKTFDKSAEAYRKLIAVYPSDRRSAESKLQAGWAAHNAGLYAKALRRANELLNQTTGRSSHTIRQLPEWLYLKANCERQLMKNDAAVRTYSQLLKQYPDCGFTNAARYEKALTCYRMGKFREAVTGALEVERTRGRKPEEKAGRGRQMLDIRKDVYWLLAESYSALKEEDDAVQYYRLIAKEFPKSDMAADAVYRLAHHLQARGEYKEASRHYGAVAANFPDNKLVPQALFASALCLSKEKMHAEAVRDWSILIRKYPSDPLVEESLYQQAMSETRLRRDKEAMASLLKLLRTFPKTRFAADAHFWRGMLLKETGGIKDAEGEFRLALKSLPRKELARETKFYLGVVLQKTGKLDESADLFQPLLSSPLRARFSPALLEWLSEYKFEKKRFRDSVEAAQLLVERSSEAAWQQIGWCLIGRGHLAGGNTAKAEKSFKKSLAAKASTHFAAESALRLGEITLSAKNYEDSTKYFERAGVLASDDSLLGIRARAYAGLGRTAKARSDLNGAARYFMSVAILYDDSELVPECLYEAAESFRKLGKDGKSKKAVKELIERYPKSEWAKKSGLGSK